MSAKWKNSSLVLSAIALTASLYGQGVLPSQPQPAQPQPQSIEVPRQNVGVESDTFLEGTDRIFDTDSDSIDFEEGGFNWKGRTFTLGDNRLIRARFERYLASPIPAENIAEYERLLQDIETRLQVNNLELNAEVLEELWNLLFEAAEYQIDGGNSLIVANQVFNAWRIRQEREAGRTSQLELERVRKVQQEILVNRAEFLERAERRQRENDERGEGNRRGSGGGQSSSGLATEAQFRAMDLQETESRIKALEAQNATTGIQAKLQFQTQIVGFIVQRRFRHAMIAASFYRLIFKGSAQTLEVGKDQLSDILLSTDASQSVNTLDQLSAEAKNDVLIGMSAVTASYTRGELFSALQRLQETFFLGEHLSPVILFDPEIKRELFDFYRDAREAKKLFDLKDYARVDELAKGMQERASDFSAAQILSASSSAQRLSDLALLAAQQSIALQEFDKADISLSRATMLWPLNPRIEQFTQDMTSRVDTRNVATTEFDRMYETGNFRGLYNDRARLGVALMTDPERAELLKSAIDRVARIDISLAQARELSAQENPYAAWELLSAATVLDPKDVELNIAKSEIAPQAASFVEKLNSAKKLEVEGKWPISLALYLAAQDIYPASQTSREAIERLTERIFIKAQESSSQNMNDSSLEEAF
ncbi:MAG: hypothetical protein ACPGN3_09310 [Opitutales bacterium]